MALSFLTKPQQMIFVDPVTQAFTNALSQNYSLLFLGIYFMVS
jgi:hypothetical protein